MKEKTFADFPMDLNFLHNDADSCHGQTLSLHDCVAEKVCYSDGVLRFYLSDGLWLLPAHDANELNKIVKTDAAVVDFRIKDPYDITIRVFTQRRFRKTYVECWELRDLIDAVNSGKCIIEFIYQYRTFFEQMWSCAIRSGEKPYYRECQLHLEQTEAVFRWNNLLPEREW